MYLCRGVCTRERRRPQNLKEGIRSPGATTAGSCEPPCADAGPLELQPQAVVSHPVQMLGSELRFHCKSETHS